MGRRRRGSEDDEIGQQKTKQSVEKGRARLAVGQKERKQQQE